MSRLLFGILLMRLLGLALAGPCAVDVSNGQADMPALYSLPNAAYSDQHKVYLIVWQALDATGFNSVRGKVGFYSSRARTHVCALPTAEKKGWVWGIKNNSLSGAVFLGFCLAQIMKDQVPLGESFEIASSAASEPSVVYSGQDELFLVSFVRTTMDNAGVLHTSAMLQRVDAVGALVGEALNVSQLGARSIGAPTARLPIVKDWSVLVLSVIRTAGLPPPKVARALAMIHIAAFEAGNSIDQRYLPYQAYIPMQAAQASVEAAVAQAAHDVLVALIPSASTAARALLNTHLAALPMGLAQAEGVRLGSAAAAQMLASRADDGAAVAGSYTVAPDVYIWRPTLPAFAAAVLPAWGDVKPFGRASFVDIGTPGLVPLASPRYLAEWNEVRLLGSATSAARTVSQTNSARMWAAGGGTVTPPGLWMQVSQSAVETLQLGTLEAARLFAVVAASLANAGIECWHVKYTHSGWRPITAIREAASDGLNSTTGDPSWLPLLNTPPFPGFTSGHSTFSAAAAAALSGVLGTDRLDFSLTSEGVTLSFRSFSEAAEDAGRSRIYGGIHFQADNEFGSAAGRAIGAWQAANMAQPVQRRIEAAQPVTAVNVAQAETLVVFVGSSYDDRKSCMLFSQRIRGGVVMGPSQELGCFSALEGAQPSDVSLALAYALTTDEYLLVFSGDRYDVPASGLQALRLGSSDGLALGPVFTISQTLGGVSWNHAFDPAIAYDPLGAGYLVAYVGEHDGPRSVGVFAQYIDATGAARGTNTRLSNGAGTRPRLQHLGLSGQFVACWEGFSGADSEPASDAYGVNCLRVQAAPIVSLGSVHPISQRLTGSLAGGSSQSPALAAGSRDCAVFWQQLSDRSGSASIYGTFMRPDNLELSASCPDASSSNARAHQRRRTAVNAAVGTVCAVVVLALAVGGLLVFLRARHAVSRKMLATGKESSPGAATALVHQSEAALEPGSEVSCERSGEETE